MRAAASPSASDTIGEAALADRRGSLRYFALGQIRKVDGSVAAVVLESHGARVEVRAPTSLLDLVVEQALPFARVAGPGTSDVEVAVTALREHRWRVTGTRPIDATTCEGSDATVAVHVLDCLHPLFAEHAREALFVHAGVFEIDGSLVLVPGRSHTGKSTLVAAALRRGATYYSDEFAVIDPDGLVHPYPRPLSLRRPGHASRSVSAAELGGGTATTPAPAAVVLSTRYCASASWAPELVIGARAALPVIDNTLRARTAPGPTTRAAARLARTAITWVGERGEADDLLDWFDEPGHP